MGAKTIASIDGLAAAGLLSPERAHSLRAVEAHYSVAVTPALAALIDPADPADPIARQFVPDERELETRVYERADPIGDDAHSPVEGLVHRYPDRVLLKVSSTCPVYCRFCFRRARLGSGKGSALSNEALDAALAYIAARPEIFEVILTGGDPLVLSARRLRALAERLRDIPHIRVMRVHTRVPIAAPDLATEDRLRALLSSGKTIYMVLHVNHRCELTAKTRAAIAGIQDFGVSTLAQTVLLAGVNDDADTLERLMRDLTALRVKPYYLHHLDPAPGTAHFRVRIEDGRRIYDEIARRLSGLALPLYVLDIPGGFGKVPVAGPHVVKGADGTWRVVDRAGRTHVYPAGE